MNCSNSIEHTVEAGDTLYKLSRQYKTTVSSIILSNPRINPYNLQIGMKIEICPGREYTRPEMLGNTENSGISNNNGKGNLKELMRMASYLSAPDAFGQHGCGFARSAGTGYCIN